MISSQDYARDKLKDVPSSSLIIKVQGKENNFSVYFDFITFIPSLILMNVFPHETNDCKQQHFE